MTRLIVIGKSSTLTAQLAALQVQYQGLVTSGPRIVEKGKRQ